MQGIMRSARIVHRAMVVDDLSLSGMADLPTEVVAEAIGALEYACGWSQELSDLCYDARQRLLASGRRLQSVGQTTTMTDMARRQRSITPLVATAAILLATGIAQATTVTTNTEAAACRRNIASSYWSR